MCACILVVGTVAEAISRHAGGGTHHDLLDAQFTSRNVAAKVDYLAQANRGTFERPYGWGWLLMLAGELSRFEPTEGVRWSVTLHPLVSVFVEHFLNFLPKATYPIRAGTHFNSAFAFVLALDYADAVGDTGFASLICEKARSWYGSDRDCQVWEPSGDDFLSSALIEAECMRRAWCWRRLAGTFDAQDPQRAFAVVAANDHLKASLPYVAGDYVGEHWLATFALLAMEG